MRYHNITTDDMLNGDGLRTVLWVAGCCHHCSGCQNPVTWDPNGGVYFDKDSEEELYNKLKPSYIDGITFSGGDPMHSKNIGEVIRLAANIKRLFPDKTVWMYTGYLWENIIDIPGMKTNLRNFDVVVDGRFVEELADVNYHWAGSTNQRVIDVQKSLDSGEVVLYEGKNNGKS